MMYALQCKAYLCFPCFPLHALWEVVTISEVQYNHVADEGCVSFKML